MQCDLRFALDVHLICHVTVIPMPSNGNARTCSKVQVADMLWHRCFLISLPFVTWNLRLQKHFYHWNSAFDAFTVCVWSCLNLLQFVSTSYRCRDHGWKSCSPSCPPIPEACWVCFGWIAMMAEESWSLLWFTPRGPMMTPMKGAWTGWRMMADDAGCNWIQWQHKQHQNTRRFIDLYIQPEGTFPELGSKEEC
jgi:hypothetical protein